MTPFTHINKVDESRVLVVNEILEIYSVEDIGNERFVISKRKKDVKKNYEYF